MAYVEALTPIKTRKWKRMLNLHAQTEREREG